MPILVTVSIVDGKLARWITSNPLPPNVIDPNRYLAVKCTAILPSGISLPWPMVVGADKRGSSSDPAPVLPNDQSTRRNIAKQLKVKRLPPPKADA